jgi:hypothetical protein
MPDEQPNPPVNKPPEGEIPDILEWKLDVIMEQLATMGGGRPDPKLDRPTTREKLPDPGARMPGDPIPVRPGIPEILEWKLDAIIFDLDDIFAAFSGLDFLLQLIYGALVAIFALLLLIALILVAIIPLLGAVIVVVIVLLVGLLFPLFLLRSRRRHHRLHLLRHHHHHP